MSEITSADYCVFIDESIIEKGAVNVVVYAACILLKNEYATIVVPELLKLKFDVFGKEGVVIHAQEFARRKGIFELPDDKYDALTAGITNLVKKAPMVVIASAVKPRDLRKPEKSLEFSITLLMERVYDFVTKEGKGGTTHVTFEASGQSKTILDLAERVANKDNYKSYKMDICPAVADKKENSAGLQLADLVAYPIAHSVAYPDKPFRPADIVKAKLWKIPGYEKNLGLKIFPE